MHCPRDKSEMQHQAFWKYPRHACPQCKGIFVAERDLTENIGSAGRKFDAVAGVKVANVRDGQLACPKDSIPMKIVKFADAELDVCPACNGLWLDHGEFEKVKARTKAGPAVSPSLKHTAREAPAVEPERDEGNAALEFIGELFMTRGMRRLFRKLRGGHFV